MSESKGERSAAAIGSPEKDGNKWDAKDDAYLDTDSLMQVAESKTDGSYVAPSGMKHDAKVEEPLSDEEILARLQQFFFEDPNFGSSLESFVRDNCSIVDLSTEEFQLQYTAVFEDYKRLFEAQMESFIERDLKVSIQVCEQTSPKTSSLLSIHHPDFISFVGSVPCS